MLNLANNQINPTDVDTIHHYLKLHQRGETIKVTLYRYYSDRNAIRNYPLIDSNLEQNIKLSIFDQRQFLIFRFDNLSTKSHLKNYEIIVSKFDIAKHYNIQDIKLIHTFVPHLFNNRNESEIVKCGDHYELNKLIIDGINDHTFYVTNVYEPISISLNNIVERIIDDSVWLVLTNNYSWPK